MRILFITGSYYPEVCGVGDYTARLAEALVRERMNVAVLSREHCLSTGSDGPEIIGAARDWRVVEADELLRRIDKWRPDVVHLQYPGRGFGTALGPHMLAMKLSFGRVPLLLTLHEYVISHPLRRLSVIPLLLRADQVIFTTRSEKEAVASEMGWLRRQLGKAGVIPIGSNLPDVVAVGGYEPTTFSFWGMLHRGKGLESLLSAVRIAAQRVPALRLQIIGAVRDRDRAYIEHLDHLAQGLGISGRIDKQFDRSAEDVVRLLQRSCGVVLPFADGATFRRGTLVAALRLRIPVITSQGSDTPSELVDGQNVLFAHTPADFAGQMVRLSDDQELRAGLAAGESTLSPSFGWDVIALRHIDIYRRLLGR